MDQIGYSLVDLNGNEVMCWGDTERQCEGSPSSIVLPNGDHVHSPAIGMVGDVWRLVPRYLSFGGSSKVEFDGERVVVTRLVSQDHVIAERERRMALGFDYDFQDARGVHRFGTTQADMKGWDDVDKSVNAMMTLGFSGVEFPIDTNTGPVLITPIDWAKITMGATAFRSPLWMKSFALLAMAPIPSDFASDAYWS
jgi:hypothetical protein